MSKAVNENERIERLIDEALDRRINDATRLEADARYEKIREETEEATRLKWYDYVSFVSWVNADISLVVDILWEIAEMLNHKKPTMGRVNSIKIFFLNEISEKFIISP